jgi:tetratricopeptide (TPR) repeat protein
MQAIEEPEASVRIDPSVAQTHRDLGVALSRLPGHMPDAIAELEEAWRLAPTPEMQRLLNNLKTAFARSR